MLRGDSDILNDKLKKCFKTGDFSDLDCLFEGRIDVGREIVRRWPDLFKESAMRRGSNGNIVQKTFTNLSKARSLPGVIEVLKANRRLNLL